MSAHTLRENKRWPTTKHRMSGEKMCTQNEQHSAIRAATPKYSINSACTTASFTCSAALPQTQHCHIRHAFGLAHFRPLPNNLLAIRMISHFYRFEKLQCNSLLLPIIISTIRIYHGSAPIRDHTNAYTVHTRTRTHTDFDEIRLAHRRCMQNTKIIYVIQTKCGIFYCRLGMCIRYRVIYLFVRAAKLLTSRMRPRRPYCNDFVQPRFSIAHFSEYVRHSRDTKCSPWKKKLTSE